MKHKFITIRVTDEEKKRIKEKSKEKKLSISKMFVALYYRFSDNL